MSDFLLLVTETISTFPLFDHSNTLLKINVKCKYVVSDWSTAKNLIRYNIVILTLNVKYFLSTRVESKRMIYVVNYRTVDTASLEFEPVPEAHNRTMPTLKLKPVEEKQPTKGVFQQL